MISSIRTTESDSAFEILNFGWMKMLKNFSDQIDKGNPAPTEAVFHVPPSEPIQEMKKRLNMDLEISTGQRKIGPPLDFTGKPAKQVIST